LGGSAADALRGKAHRDAVAVTRRNRIPGAGLVRDIDLLLTDLVMPTISGADLAERLVRERPGIARVFMSGYTQEASLGDRINSDGIAFVESPSTPTSS
jgi:CheY-like chemotaxis protein